MLSLYHAWITAWESKLAARDVDRQVQPFEWGTEWLSLPPGDDEAAALRSALENALERPDEFYSYRKPREFRLDGGHLTFESPIRTPYEDNNTTHADYYPGRRPTGRAALVLPQWNAAPTSHVALCNLLNRFGISALRLSMAFHGPRRPPGHVRAEFHVSSNLGRTVQATRQSVVDARCCLDWLESRGYDRLGVVGTSLGSCVAFLAAAHDPRVRAGVFNHVAGWFGDVVWTGLATRHVRASLEGHVTREQLNRYWAIISPASHTTRFRDRDFRSLMIWSAYDPVFLPEHSREVIASFQPTRALRLPCGHYTLGKFPFNWIAGLSISRFLAHSL